MLSLFRNLTLLTGKFHYDNILNNNNYPKYAIKRRRMIRLRTQIVKVLSLGLAFMLLVSGAALAALKPAEVANKTLVQITILSKITATETGASQNIDAISKATVSVGKVKLWPGTPLKGSLTMQSTSSDKDMVINQYILELGSVNYGENKPPISFTEGKVTVKETSFYGNTQTAVTVSDVYIY